MAINGSIDGNKLANNLAKAIAPIIMQDQKQASQSNKSNNTKEKAVVGVEVEAKVAGIKNIDKLTKKLEEVKDTGEEAAEAVGKIQENLNVSDSSNSFKYLISKEKTIEKINDLVQQLKNNAGTLKKSLATSGTTEQKNKITEIVKYINAGEAQGYNLNDIKNKKKVVALKDEREKFLLNDPSGRDNFSKYFTKDAFENLVKGLKTVEEIDSEITKYIKNINKNYNSMAKVAEESAKRISKSNEKIKKSTQETKVDNNEFLNDFYKNGTRAADLNSKSQGQRWNILHQMKKDVKEFSKYKIKVTYADGSEGIFDKNYNANDYSPKAALEQFNSQIIFANNQDKEKAITNIIFEEIEATEKLIQLLKELDNVREKDDVKKNSNVKSPKQDKSALKVIEEFEKGKDLLNKHINDGSSSDTIEDMGKILKLHSDLKQMMEKNSILKTETNEYFFESIKQYIENIEKEIEVKKELNKIEEADDFVPIDSVKDQIRKQNELQEELKETQQEARETTKVLSQIDDVKKPEVKDIGRTVSKEDNVQKAINEAKKTFDEVKSSFLKEYDKEGMLSKLLFGEDGSFKTANKQKEELIQLGKEAYEAYLQTYNKMFGKDISDFDNKQKKVYANKNVKNITNEFLKKLELYTKTNQDNEEMHSMYNLIAHGELRFDHRDSAKYLSDDYDRIKEMVGYNRTKFAKTFGELIDGSDLGFKSNINSLSDNQSILNGEFDVQGTVNKLETIQNKLESISSEIIEIQNNFSMLSTKNDFDTYFEKINLLETKLKELDNLIKNIKLPYNKTLYDLNENNESITNRLMNSSNKMRSQMNDKYQQFNETESSIDWNEIEKRFEEMKIFSEFLELKGNYISKELHQYNIQLSKDINEGSITGQEAIEKFDQKAKDLGLTFDEVSKKWTKLTNQEQKIENPINENNSALKFSDGTPLNEKEMAAFEKYTSMMKKQLGDTYNEAMHIQAALKLISDIKFGNVEELMGRFHNGNKASNVVLNMMTGMDVNNQKNRDLALRSINETAYDEIIAKQAEKAKAEMVNQKTDFEREWDKFAEVMLGGDIFENESKMSKGKIIKAFKELGETAEEAIDEINKKFLKGELDGKTFKNKYLQQYLDSLNDDKEYYDSLRNTKAGDLDVNSLFEFGGTKHLTEEEAQALKEEAKAYDLLIAKKKEYYGIVDESPVSNGTNTAIEEQNKLQKELEESIKKYVELREQNRFLKTAKNSIGTTDSDVYTKTDAKKEIKDLLSQIKIKESEFKLVNKNDINEYREATDELFKLKEVILDVYSRFSNGLEGNDSFLGKKVVEQIRLIKEELDSLNSEYKNFRTGYSELFGNIRKTTNIDPTVLSKIFKKAGEEGRDALYIINEINKALSEGKFYNPPVERKFTMEEKQLKTIQDKTKKFSQQISREMQRTTPDENESYYLDRLNEVERLKNALVELKQELKDVEISKDNDIYGKTEKSINIAEKMLFKHESKLYDFYENINISPIAEDNLTNSKNYVDSLSDSLINLIDYKADLEKIITPDWIEAYNRDINNILDRYPELEKFKDKLTSYDEAKEFVKTDEWNDFLATLPQAHEYLESIGYDFTRIKQSSDAIETPISKDDKQIRSLEQVNKELEKERQNLKQIEEQDKKNENAIEKLQEKRENYSKEVFGNDKASYDIDNLREASNKLKSFNSELDKRNQFEEKYLDLVQIISKNYIGQYGISNGVYKDLDDFISSNFAMKQLENLHKNGIKGVPTKDINTLFKNVIMGLRSEGATVSSLISSGDVNSGHIITELAKEEKKLLEERQSLYDARQKQLTKINNLQKEQLDLMMKTGKASKKDKQTIEGNTSNGNLFEDNSGQLSFIEETRKTVDLIEEETGQMAMFENIAEKATNSAVEGQMELNDVLNKNIKGQMTLNDLTDIINDNQKIQKELVETENTVNEVSRAYNFYKQRTEEYNKEAKNTEEIMSRLIPLLKELKRNKGNVLYSQFQSDEVYEGGAELDKKFLNDYFKKIPTSKKGIKEYIDKILSNGDQKEILELQKVMSRYEDGYWSTAQVVFDDLKSKSSKKKALYLSNFVNEYVEEWKRLEIHLNRIRKNITPVIKELLSVLNLGNDRDDHALDSNIFNMMRILSEKGLYQNPDDSYTHIRDIIENPEKSLKKLFDWNNYINAELFKFIDISDIDNVDKLNEKLIELRNNVESLDKQKDEAYLKYIDAAYSENTNLNEDVEWEKYQNLKKQSEEIWNQYLAYERLDGIIKKQQSEINQSNSLDSNTAKNLQEVATKAEKAEQAIEEYNDAIRESEQLNNQKRFKVVSRENTPKLKSPLDETNISKPMKDTFDKEKTKLNIQTVIADIDKVIEKCNELKNIDKKARTTAISSAMRNIKDVISKEDFDIDNITDDQIKKIANGFWKLENAVDNEAKEMAFGIKKFLENLLDKFNIEVYGLNGIDWDGNVSAKEVIGNQGTVKDTLQPYISKNGLLIQKGSVELSNNVIDLPKTIFEEYVKNITQLKNIGLSENNIAELLFGGLNKEQIVLALNQKLPIEDIVKQVLTINPINTSNGTPYDLEGEYKEYLTKQDFSSSFSTPMKDTFDNTSIDKTTNSLIEEQKEVEVAVENTNKELEEQIELKQRLSSVNDKDNYSIETEINDLNRLQDEMEETVRDANDVDVSIRNIGNDKPINIDTNTSTSTTIEDRKDKSKQQNSLRIDINTEEVLTEIGRIEKAIKELPDKKEILIDIKENTLLSKDEQTKIDDSDKEEQLISSDIENQNEFKQLLDLIEKIENSLSSMKKVFVDVGDGEEFSPLLKMINSIRKAFVELSDSIKNEFNAITSTKEITSLINNVKNLENELAKSKTSPVISNVNDEIKETVALCEKSVELIKRLANYDNKSYQRTEQAVLMNSGKGASTEIIQGKSRSEKPTVNIASLMAENLNKGFDTIVHSHPSNFAAFSENDLKTSFKQVKDGFFKSIVVAFDQMATLNSGAITPKDQEFLINTYKEAKKQIEKKIIDEFKTYGNLELALNKYGNGNKAFTEEFNKSFNNVDEMFSNIIEKIKGSIEEYLYSTINQFDKNSKFAFDDFKQSLANNVFQDVNKLGVQAGLSSSDIQQLNKEYIKPALQNALTAFSKKVSADIVTYMNKDIPEVSNRMAKMQNQIISATLTKLGYSPDVYKVEPIPENIKQQTKQSVVGNLDKEREDLSELANHIHTVVIKAINAKTEAFRDEKEKVNNYVKAEIADLESLRGKIEKIIENLNLLKEPIKLNISAPKDLTFIADLKDSLETTKNEILGIVNSIQNDNDIETLTIDINTMPIVDISEWKTTIEKIVDGLIVDIKTNPVVSDETKKDKETSSKSSKSSSSDSFGDDDENDEKVRLTKEKQDEEAKRIRDTLNLSSEKWAISVKENGKVVISTLEQIGKESKKVAHNFSNVDDAIENFKDVASSTTLTGGSGNSNSTYKMASDNLVKLDELKNKLANSNIKENDYVDLIDIQNQTGRIVELEKELNDLKQNGTILTKNEQTARSEAVKLLQNEVKARIDANKIATQLTASSYDTAKKDYGFKLDKFLEDLKNAKFDTTDLTNKAKNLKNELNNVSDKSGMAKIIADFKTLGYEFSYLKSKNNGEILDVDLAKSAMEDQLNEYKKILRIQRDMAKLEDSDDLVDKSKVKSLKEQLNYHKELFRQATEELDIYRNKDKYAQHHGGKGVEGALNSRKLVDYEAHKKNMLSSTKDLRDEIATIKEENKAIKNKGELNNLLKDQENEYKRILELERDIAKLEDSKKLEDISDVTEKRKSLANSRNEKVRLDSEIANYKDDDGNSIIDLKQREQQLEKNNKKLREEIDLIKARNLVSKYNVKDIKEDYNYKLNKLSEDLKNAKFDTTNLSGRAENLKQNLLTSIDKDSVANVIANFNKLNRDFAILKAEKLHITPDEVLAKGILEEHLNLYKKILETKAKIAKLETSEKLKDAAKSEGLKEDLNKYLNRFKEKTKEVNDYKDKKINGRNIIDYEKHKENLSKKTEGIRDNISNIKKQNKAILLQREINELLDEQVQTWKEILNIQKQIELLSGSTNLKDLEKVKELEEKLKPLEKTFDDLSSDILDHEKESFDGKRVVDLDAHKQNLKDLTDKAENEIAKEKANKALREQVKYYHDIFETKKQIAILENSNDPEKDDKIDNLKNQLKTRLDSFKEITKQVNEYKEQGINGISGDILIDSEKQANNLLKATENIRKQIKRLKEKKTNDSKDSTSTTSVEEEIRNLSLTEQAYESLIKTYDKYLKLKTKKDNDTITSSEHEDYNKLDEKRKVALETINDRLLEIEKNKNLVQQAGIKLTEENLDLIETQLGLKKEDLELTEEETKLKKRYDKKINDNKLNEKEYNSQEEKIKNILKTNPDILEANDKLKNIKPKNIAELEPIIDETRNKIRDLSLEFANGRIDLEKYQKKVNDLINDINRTFAIVGKDSSIEQVENQIKDFYTQLDRLGGKGVEIKSTFDNANNTYKITASWVDKNVDLVRTLGHTWDVSTGQITTGIQRNSKYMSEWGKTIEWLKNKWINLGGYLLSFGSVYELWYIFKQGINVVRQFDTALTEMRKVSDETVKSLKNFQGASFDIAENVGTTALQIQNSTADFMRLGESLDKASKSAQATNILFNVSEFESIEDATNAMVSMSQAYQDLDKLDIVNKANVIGNNFAISTDGLATALQDSASALMTAGNDFDEAVALITAGNIVAQDPNSVGSGMRTIALRLTGTKEGKKTLEELGEETENVITTVSKLRDTIMSATAVKSNDFKGFDILDENGNYKSTYEIMLGLSDIYQEIVETDKKMGNNNLNLLLETIAGKNRANIAASILQNKDVLEKAYDKSANGYINSAIEENEKKIQSIDGRIQEFTNSVQELATIAINSDLVKFFVDLGTIGVKNITGLINLMTPLGAALSSSIGVFLGFKDISIFKSIFNAFIEIDEATNKWHFSLKKIKNLKNIFGKFNKTLIDSTAVELYNNAIDEANSRNADFAERQDIMQAAMESTNKETAKLIESTKGARVETDALTAAQQANTVAMKAGAIAMKALSIVGNMILITLVTKGISTMIGKFSEWSNAAEEAKKRTDSLMESFNSALDTANANAKRVDELKDKYAKLSKGVNHLGENVSLTTEEYKEYNSIVNEIADMFPDLVQRYTEEGNAVLSLKGNVEQLTNAYKDAQEAAYNLLIANGEDSDGNDILEVWNSKNNTKFLNKALNFGSYEVGKEISQADALSQLETVTEMSFERFKEIRKTVLEGTYEELNKLTEAEKGIGHGNYIFKALGIDANVTETEFAHARKEAKALAKIYNAEIETALSNVKSIANAYLMVDKNYKKLDDQAKNAASILVNSLDKEIASEFKDESKIEEYVDNILQGVSSDKNVSKAMNELFAMDKKGKSVNKIKQLTDEYVDTIAKAIGEDSEKLKLRLKLDSTDTDALINKVKNFLEDEFDDKVGELTLEDLNIAATLDPAETKENIEAELKILEQGGAVDLVLHPKVDASELNKKDWNVEEGITTVNATTISNTDFEDLMPNDRLDTIAINFTPIIADPETGEHIGTLSKKELYDYAHDVISGIREDDLNLQIGSKFEGVQAIKEAKEAVLKINELHERYLIDGDVLLSWDELINKIKEAKNLNSGEVSLFSIESNNEAIDKFEEKIESLKSALATIQSGEMKGEALINLLQQFPELEDKTDNLTEAIQELADESLDNLFDVLGGDVPEEIKDTFEGIADEVINMADSFNSFSPLPQIQALSVGLDQLDKIYLDILDKEDFDWSSILNNDGFTEAFGNLENATGAYKNVYSDFINTIASSPNDINACQQAFNNLAGAYIYNSGALQGVTAETKNVAVAMLEQMGITNANAIVTEYLAAQEIYLKLCMYDTTNEVIEQANQLVGLSNMSGIARAALYELYVQEKILANQDLGVEDKIQQLADLAMAFGLTADSAMTMAQVAAEAVKAVETEAEVNEIVVTLSDNFQSQIAKAAATYSVPVNYGGGSQTRSYKKQQAGSGSAKKEETEEEIDWIERKIQVLTDGLEKVKTIASDIATRFQNQNKYLDDAIKKTKSLKSIYQQSYNKYMEKANKVGLSSSLKDKVHNGSIEIKTYKGKELEKIKEYQEWYDKAQEMKGMIDQLNMDIKDMSLQKLTNIQDDYEMIISYYEKFIEIRETKIDDNFMSDKDYDYIVGKYKTIKNNLLDQQKDLQKQFDKLVKTGQILEGSDVWYEWKDVLADVGIKIEEINQQLEDLLDKRFDETVTKYDDKEEYQRALVDLKKTKAGDDEDLTESDYNYMIKKENHIKYNKTKELAELTAIIAAREKYEKGYKGSTRWYDDKVAVTNLEAEIVECTNATEEFGQAIAELRWKKFDEGMKKLEDIKDVMDDISGLFDGDSYYNPKEIKENLGDQLETLGANGVVDLTNERKINDKGAFKDAGYKYVNQDTDTIFIKTRYNEDKTVAMNFTPIMIDPVTGEETILDAKEFRKYTNDVINGVREDDLNLKIGATFEGEDAVEKAKNAAKEIKELQDRYFNDKSLQINGVQLTEDGLVNITLAFKKMAVAKQEIENCKRALSKLNTELEKGQIDQEYYNERMEELIDTQNAAALAIKENETAIIDIYIEGIEAEIDAFNDLVDKKKEALEIEKDLADQQKESAKERDNILLLEKKIAELSRSTDRKDIAQRLKLEKELKEAKEEAAEKQADREHDEKLDALDKEKEAFEKKKNQEIWDAKNDPETRIRILDEAFKTMQENWTNTAKNINDTSKRYGLDIKNYANSSLDEILQGAKSVDNMLKSIDYNKEIDISTKPINLEQLDKTTKDMVEKLGLTNTYTKKGFEDVLNKMGEKAYKEEYDTVINDLKEIKKIIENKKGTKDEPVTTPPKAPAEPPKKQATKVSEINKVLQKGDKDSINKNNDVKLMQAALAKLGYFIGEEGLDGSFGASTKGALERFQKDNDLKVSGKLDETTRKLLGDKVKTGLKFNKVSEIGYTLKKGNKENKTNDIKTLQKALSALGYDIGTQVNGKFGDGLVKAVKKFQKDNGLTEDGKVGAKTKAKFKAKGYKTGVVDLKQDELAIINEVGQETILRPSEGIIFPMQKHDTVLTAEQTDNLIGLSKLSREDIATKLQLEKEITMNLSELGINRTNLVPNVSSNCNCGLSSIGDISVMMNITGVTREEINKETQKMINNIPNQIMTEMRKHGVGVNGRRH